MDGSVHAAAILCVLGMATLVAPSGLAVPPAALAFDLPVMLAVAVVCLPVFMAGHRIDRWEGLVFLGYYVVYVLFLVLTAVDHDSRYLLGQAGLWFAFPLTGLPLTISMWRHRLDPGNKRLSLLLNRISQNWRRSRTWQASPSTLP